VAWADFGQSDELFGLTGSLFHAYSHNLRIVIVAKAEDL